ncbi:MAG TPA: WecB/TagA/CpsF family glycosyltransferase [Bacillota bacterium]
MLGSPVDRITLAGAVNRILDLAESGRQGAGEPGGHGWTRWIVTANPEILIAARRDATMARILEEAALVVPDGIGVVFAARWLGAPVPERVPGIELLEALLGAAAERGLRPYLLGARPEVIAEAARRIEQRFTGLRLAGWRDGYFALDDPRPVADVANSDADLLFVGMGAERELKWIYAHRQRLGVPVAIGVGGSFDVLSGRLRRAPVWMRRVHLEWLYRLLREPARWRRQLALPAFALAVATERWRKGAGR